MSTKANKPSSIFLNKLKNVLIYIKVFFQMFNLTICLFFV